MHRTLGDGYIEVNGKRLYADEDLSSGRDATQVRHEEMNSLQEEICNVIEAEGLTLNSPSESISSMNQLNTAINNKLKTDRIVNQSSISGSNLTNVLNSIKSVNDTQQSAISTQASAIGALQGAIGTVSGGDLQSQITTEKTRNDTQDGEITALQAQIGALDPVGAVKGDALIFDTADNKWHPDSSLAFRPRLQINTKNDGLAASWIGAPYAKWQFTGIEINLCGRYADIGEDAPQAATRFQYYVIPSADIEEWQVTAVYNGWNWNIRGSFVVKLPNSISNGYNGYTTSIYQAMWVKFLGAPQNLWHGRLDYYSRDGLGRTMAPYKRFANLADNVRYAGDQSGFYICTARENGIFLGDHDHWFWEFTRDDARLMPGIFTPGRKYAISFDVQAVSYTNVIT